MSAAARRSGNSPGANVPVRQVAIGYGQRDFSFRFVFAGNDVRTRSVRHNSPGKRSDLLTRNFHFAPVFAPLNVRRGSKYTACNVRPRDDAAPVTNAFFAL